MGTSVGEKHVPSLFTNTYEETETVVFPVTRVHPRTYQDISMGKKWKHRWFKANTVTYLPATAASPGGLTSDTYSDLVWSLPPGLAVMRDFIHELKYFHGLFYHFTTLFSFLHRSLLSPFIKVKPVYWPAYRMGANGSKSWQRQEIFSSPNRPDWIWGPPNFLFNGYREQYFGAHSGCGMMLITDLYSGPKWRMSGAIPLLSPYAFGTWTGTNLPLPLPLPF
jgi:hypothetical protein